MGKKKQPKRKNTKRKHPVSALEQLTKGHVVFEADIINAISELNAKVDFLAKLYGKKPNKKAA